MFSPTTVGLSTSGIRGLLLLCLPMAILRWDLGLFQCSLQDLTRVRIRQSIDMLLTLSSVSRRLFMQAQGLFTWGALWDHSVRPLISVTRRVLTRVAEFLYPPPLMFRMYLVTFRNGRFIPLPHGVPSQFLKVLTDTSGVGWGINFPQSLFSGMFDASLFLANIALKELRLSFLGFASSTRLLQCPGTYGF